MVYLGAAPGVGKTFAMLDEAARRRLRGADVVVGIVETHGRPATVAKLEGLEIVPRRTIEYRGTTLTEMDVDAVLARHPAIVLVDELAHTNAPGAAHAKRWQDVHQLLDAGIDVVTTVNVQHLASLTDDVEAVTGIRQRETVPDQVVRDADQIQLVDLSPQQLRRRLAHGNVYRPEQIDASLGAYFREGNLTALRELALLWLADRVDDALTRYRSDHAITGTWPARERIVVAVTGGPETETIIRRGARIAQRAAGSELVAVHVLPTDGLPSATPATIAAQRALVESLDGTFHTVVGEEVPAAIVDFARGVNATMIVVGVSRHSRLRQALLGSTSAEIARLSGTIDVHLVTHEAAGAGVPSRSRWSALSTTRRTLGFAGAVLAPLALTALLLVVDHAPKDLSSPLLFFLAVVVGVAIVGGMWPALVAALASFLCLNFFFVAPVRQFTVASSSELLALGIFVVVAVAVARVVDEAARRTGEAYQARAEASTLAALSRSVLSGEDTAQAVVARLAETFALREVRLEVRESDRSPWVEVAEASSASPDRADDDVSEVTIDGDHRLMLVGRALPARDRQAVEAFGAQARLVLEHRKLREAAFKAHALEQAEATRTALLAAVSHDLRTPLASIRAAVDGLTSPDVELDPEDTEALEHTLSESTGRLERLIDNLLDLSRLQTGAVRPVLREASLEAVVLQAVEPWLAALDLDVPENLPLVTTDPGLLERVVANIVSNAVRHAGSRVRVSAGRAPDGVVVRVVDTGPGVPDDRKGSMFQPFQRLGDTSGTGLGLGLAVADGLATAVGASIVAEDTPGGGLTMVVTVPTAAAPMPVEAAPEQPASDQPASEEPAR
ncbi:sensor histidine kinase KdpD [Xylanimonas protaetiae]|uniref:histidine kinase n=2 Tax=Xylanimonas protaetiae TaxID=2509457 RepID=A0A4V0YGN4_9MICO|nr:sensor histidine kinase KdpD [Xylanimonas protaetiae]